MITYSGSLVQSCCVEGGTLQTNITGMCGKCSQCLGHTGFAPAHGVCTFPVYNSQALGCFAGELSDAVRDWGQEEKGTTEDEMAGWHH